MINQKRTYITKEELNKVLTYLKDNKLYEYYLIVLCLSELSIKFNYLKDLTWDKTNILFSNKQDVLNELQTIRGKNNDDKIIKMTIRGFNKTIKKHQIKMGMNHIIDFSTKLFNTKIIIDSKEVYGYIEYKGSSKILKERKDNYIYVLKHNHRNNTINNLLTDKKIGITNNPYNRKSTLTLGPVGIECLKLWKVDVCFIGKIEKLLHKKFEKRNVIGEWFEDENNSLITEIEKEIMTLRLMDMYIEEVPTYLMSKYILEDNLVD